MTYQRKIETIDKFKRFTAGSYVPHIKNKLFSKIYLTVQSQININQKLKTLRLESINCKCFILYYKYAINNL